MFRIFVSYRREDSSSDAAAMASALRSGPLGRKAVFLDTTSIEPGGLWPGTIKTALKDATHVLVVVGPDWLGKEQDSGTRRIDEEDDWVRQEVAFALKARKKIIPVLVSGGSLPPADVLPKDIAAITQYQAVHVRRDYFEHDLRLISDRFKSKRTLQKMLAAVLSVSLVAAIFVPLVRNALRNSAPEAKLVVSPKSGTVPFDIDADASASADADGDELSFELNGRLTVNRFREMMPNEESRLTSLGQSKSPFALEMERVSATMSISCRHKHVRLSACQEKPT